MGEILEEPLIRAKPVEQVAITALRGGSMGLRSDAIVGEEPLEIRIANHHAPPVAVGVTMRTPGNDFELAAGFLLSEGFITAADDVRAIRYCTDDTEGIQHYNIVTVDTMFDHPIAARRSNLTVSASCGVCGTTTIEQLALRCSPLVGRASMTSDVLTSLPERLRLGQRVFEKTGGLHAAGLYDTNANRMIQVREDIGRHNAVDKLVGWALLRGDLPLDAQALVVSGRVSFEIVQKAALAGVSILVAVSAPSSLAVSTASQLGMTLVAFVRDDRANIYSHPWRIEDLSEPNLHIKDSAATGDEVAR